MQQLIMRRLREEEGIATIMVIGLMTILIVLSAGFVDVIQSDSARSATAVQRDASLAAAEAGIDNYLSKLVDDNQYYLHDVAAGESTRNSGSVTTSSSCSPSPAPAGWTGGTTWTYPNGSDQWCALGNGYEFNLQITPPSASGAQYVDIVSTGRRTGTTSNYRKLEVQVRPSSVADFLMLTNSDYNVGSTATTYGKIYAGIDSNGVKHSINHDGTVCGNLYAEGSVTGNYNRPNPCTGNTQQASVYTSSNIRTVIKQPIDFSNFTSSLTDIQRAAGLSGIVLPNNTNVDAYRLTFLSNGTVQVASCTESGGHPIESTAPNCSTFTPSGCTAGVCNVPANGAIYATQSVIVSGGTQVCGASPGGSCVNGRVTVATNNDIVVGGNIDYVQTGDDVLGLIAANDVIVAQWSPNDLWWRAAVIAQNGARHSASSDGSHDTATFTGSTTSNGSAYMDMFDTRVYNYDASLEYLQPPWFPTIDFAYTILLYRELPAP